jgi:hypothetical protein
VLNTRDSLTARLMARVDELPEFARPIVYGALVVLFAMSLRGALFIVPIVVIYVLATSHTPLADLTLGASVAGLAVIGGAFAGLSYSLLGRYVRRFGLLGRYFAGITTIAPYILVLIFIIRVADHKALYAPLIEEDWVIFAFMSVFFGIVIGASWFREKRSSEPA